MCRRQKRYFLPRLQNIGELRLARETLFAKILGAKSINQLQK